MQAIRIGQFVGRAETLERLGDRRKLASIKSWENGKSPAASASIKAAARGGSICLEPVFDASHGFRYLCFAYTNAAERAACWALLTV